MSTSFQPAHGLIVVNALVEGPTGARALRLALDTAATRTVIGADHFIALGYDLPGLGPRVRVTMGGSVEYSPLVAVERLEALGQYAESLPVLAHTLRPSASVDGVLGLDFLRGKRLTIDFRSGEIDIT